METTITAYTATNDVSGTTVNSDGDICDVQDIDTRSQRQILMDEEVAFLAADDVVHGMRYFRLDEISTTFRDEIVDGVYRKDTPIEVHAKGENGKWSSEETTVADIARHHYAIDVLYRPVSARARAGLKWGAITGAALKLGDTFLGLMSVDPAMGFMFAIAVAVCVIPRIGWMGVAAAIYVMTKYTAVNFFLMGLTSGVVGALLGSLPGMAIGGMIGLYVSRSQPQAADALPEDGGVAFRAAVLPFAAGCALLGFYVFVFNPWLFSVLAG